MVVVMWALNIVDYFNVHAAAKAATTLLKKSLDIHQLQHLDMMKLKEVLYVYYKQQT